MRRPRRRKPGIRSSAWIRPEKRWAIYLRDRHTCVWCGRTPDYPTLDHLFPRSSRFRDNDARRLVTACRSCNLSRRDTPAAAWIREIRSRGGDVAGVVSRLGRRRFPIDRVAGGLARAEDRALYLRPLSALPVGFVATSDGVPV